MKARGSTAELLIKLHDWSTGEVSGIPSVAVECVDIRKNTRGEGGLLDWARKRGEQTGLDTLVVHALNDGY